MPLHTSWARSWAGWRCHTVCDLVNCAPTSRRSYLRCSASGRWTAAAAEQSRRVASRSVCPGGAGGAGFSGHDSRRDGLDMPSTLEERGGRRSSRWASASPGLRQGPGVEGAGPSAIRRADGFGTTPLCTTAVGTSGSNRLSGPAASHDIMAAVRGMTKRRPPRSRTAAVVQWRNGIQVMGWTPARTVPVPSPTSPRPGRRRRRLRRHRPSGGRRPGAGFRDRTSAGAQAPRELRRRRTVGVRRP